MGRSPAKGHVSPGTAQRSPHAEGPILARGSPGREGMQGTIVNADHFSPDTSEFIRILDAFAVEYVIVGGEAVIFYGHVRLTGDTGFFFRSSVENTQRLFDALQAFWSGETPGVESDKALRKPGLVLQFGLPPNRIDLLNDLSGISFDEAWASRLISQLEFNDGTRVPLPYIGRECLVKNKRAAARPKDLEDVAYLTDDFRASVVTN